MMAECAAFLLAKSKALYKYDASAPILDMVSGGPWGSKAGYALWTLLQVMAE